MNTIRRFVPVLICAVVVCSAMLPAQEPAKPIHTVNPEYPALLKAAGIEGVVWMRVTIGVDGTVMSAKADKSTNEDFIPATLEAVKQWKFEAAKKDGQPVVSEVMIPFKFSLSKDSYPSRYDDLMKLQDKILGVLKGDGVDSILPRVAAESYIIVGGNYRNLREYLLDRKARTGLVEGPSMQIVFSNMQVDSLRHSALYMVKTKTGGKNPDRFHTLTMSRGDGSDW